MDRVILCLKRNDQYNPEKKNSGCKHLMPVFWWDESVQGELDLVYPRLQTEAFVHLIVNRETIPWLKEICQPELDENENIIRERKYVFRASDFKNLVNDLNIDEKMSGPNFLPVFDVSEKNLTFYVKRSIDFDWDNKEPKLDVKAVTSGIYTFGSGSDYANLVAAAADAGTQTGALTFNINSDISDSSLANFTHNSSGFDFTVGSTSPHGGDVTAGYVYSVAHSSHGIAYNMSGGGLYHISDFYIKRTVSAANTTRGLIINTNLNSPIFAHEMYLDGNGLGGSGLNMSNNNVAYDRAAYNCIIWDNDIGIYANSNGNTKGVDFENIYIRNCTTGLDNNSRGSRFRNIFSASNTTDCANTTNATGNNVSTTDATDFGTNSNGSLTELDEVVSTTDTSTDFGRLKTGGTNDGGGSAPVFATTDMAGVTYASPYPVGPFMLAVAGGPPTGTLNLLGIGV